MVGLSLVFDRLPKWRRRFAKDRLSALSDAPRSGKPRTCSHDTEARVLAMLDRAEALGDVSADQVWRILRSRGMQLQRRRS